MTHQTHTHGMFQTRPAVMENLEKRMLLPGDGKVKTFFPQKLWKNGKNEQTRVE